MINKYKKIVIKIGSSSIVNPKSKKINTKWMIKLCKDIKKYHKEKNIIIVCSGAIALGSSLIKNKNLSSQSQKKIGFPLNDSVVNRSFRATGGTVLASKLALQNRLSCNTAGGSHHATRDEGAG